MRQAKRTGFFDKVPDKQCGQELTFKQRWANRGLNSYIYSNGVISVNVARKKIQTTRGARVGTTLTQLRQKYPHLAGPTEVQWIDGPAWWAHVRKGDRYLTFFMNSSPHPRSTVKYMAVSKSEPGGFGRGC